MPLPPKLTRSVGVLAGFILLAGCPAAPVVKVPNVPKASPARSAGPVVSTLPASPAGSLAPASVAPSVLASVSVSASQIPRSSPVAPPTPPPAETGVTVGTWAGGESGFLDGPRADAKFHEPQALAIDNTTTPPTLYVAERNNLIRKIDKDGQVTRLAGEKYGASTPTAERWLDGMGATARFNKPEGLAVDPVGRKLYVADTENHRVRVIDLADPAHAVTTLAGSTVRGYADGPGASAAFDAPHDVVFDDPAAPKALFVSDAGSNRIRRIDLVAAAHTVTTVAGSGEDSRTLGPALKAGFKEIYGMLTVPGQGVLLCDDDGERVVRWRPDDIIELMAGGRLRFDAKGAAIDSNAVVGADRDGFWDEALFNKPRAIAADIAGRAATYFLVETGTHTVRKITEHGDVSTLAGPGLAGDLGKGATNGPAATARFFDPVDIVTGADGSLYVADRGNHRIRIITRPSP